MSRNQIWNLLLLSVGTLIVCRYDVDLGIGMAMLAIYSRPDA